MLNTYNVTLVGSQEPFLVCIPEIAAMGDWDLFAGEPRAVLPVLVRRTVIRSMHRRLQGES